MQPSVTERSVETVMSASERVVEASDPAEMVRQARVLGQATAHLITSIKVRTAVRLSIFILTHRITLLEGPRYSKNASVEDQSYK